MQVSEHLHTLKIPFQVPVRPELKLDRLVNPVVAASFAACLKSGRENEA